MDTVHRMTGDFYRLLLELSSLLDTSFFFFFFFFFFREIVLLKLHLAIN